MRTADSVASGHGVLGMTTSQHPAVVAEGDFDILIIHGVGNPGAGDLARAVIETLKRASLRGRATIRVSECNWNQIVEPSARGGVILESAWEDLSISLARASAIGDGLLTNNRSARLLRVLSGLALMFAELGLASAFAALLIVVPLLLVFTVLVNNETLLTLGIHAVLAVARGGVIATFGALALVVLSGLTRTLVMGAWAPLFVELRRALIFVLRPFLIVGAYFFLVPWRRLANNEWKKFFFGVAPLGTALTLVMAALLSRWADPKGFKWSEFSSAALFSYGFIVGIGMAGLAIAFVTVRTIAPSLKVLLDIFRYIGNTTYRDKIQLHLDGVIRGRSVDGGAPRPVFILSHSIGTVIALHSLLSSEEWEEDARITLITLGSPIRRYFMRFFPGLFFPASITTAAAAVAARVREFRWINCYRPFDQVGTALGLSGLAYSRDISTNQFERIWDAHPDYWSDDRVAGAITRAILETPVHSANAQEQYERLAPRQYIVTQWVDATEKFRQRISAAIFRVVAIAFIVTPPVTAAVVVWSNYSRNLTKAAEAGVIEATGISTLAAVTHWRVVDPSPGTFPSYTDNYEITYKSLDGQARASTIRYLNFTPFGDATYQANVGALLDHVRSRCSDVDPRPARRFENELVRRCRCGDVRLRYDQNAPDHFVLVDFPAKRTWWDTLRDSALQIGVTYVALSLAGMLIVGVSGRLVSMLLGVGYDFGKEQGD
jgi:hypothetical protein